MKIFKQITLLMVVIVAVSACRDDDEKVNRTRTGGGAVVSSDPSVTSVSFAECGVQITEITPNTESIVLPEVDIEGENVGNDPELNATVGFVLINDGGSVSINGRIDGADGSLSSTTDTVSVTGDGGSGVINFPLTSIERLEPAVLDYSGTLTVTANYTRPDGVRFGPCEGSRAVNLQIEVPGMVMLEEMTL